MHMILQQTHADASLNIISTMIQSQTFSTCIEEMIKFVLKITVTNTIPSEMESGWCQTGLYLVKVKDDVYELVEKSEEHIPGYVWGTTSKLSTKTLYTWTLVLVKIPIVCEITEEEFLLQDFTTEEVNEKVEDITSNLSEAIIDEIVAEKVIA